MSRSVVLNMAANYFSRNSIANVRPIAAGISFKTQALYVAVFIARYLDLLYRWVSLYNSLMKLFFIGSSCYILYLMRYRFRSVSLPFAHPDSCLTLGSPAPYFNPHICLTLQTNARPLDRYFPYRIPPWSFLCPRLHLQLPLLPYRDPMVLLHLPRISGHPPPTVHAPKNWRGRDHHDTLFSYVGHL